MTSGKHFGSFVFRPVSNSLPGGFVRGFRQQITTWLTVCPRENMTCPICGYYEENDTHALLECPLAVQIWEGSLVNSDIWDAKYRSMEDCIVKVAKQSDPEMLSNLILNFDGEKVGESGWGRGFDIRNSLRDVMMAGTIQGHGFIEPVVEEALACLLGMQCVLGAGFDNIVVEGDCQSLIQTLDRRRVQDTFAGFIVKDILSLASSFGFCSWSFVKGGGNRVAHELAHLQPFCFCLRT
ncbi:hypothetical protein Cgig2_030171 [Carnegiea gigantea]|uniref:RNase H type-1 domain-containing protein n=1 Tax=Carnegiea gigantea TaxID=171969 RepID=A0A9Q1KAC7_9CARY|nr:hypothetical protein Cgig2_030171 [Carnegiea gigantea]